MKKKRLILLFILFITLIFCLPLFTSVSLYTGHDTDYHIARIYSLAQAIKYHDYFPSLFYNQCYGYGYASPLFYSNFLIYIPSFLNVLGLNITISYKVLLLLCVMISALLMFMCSYKIFNSLLSGAFSSTLYIFSGYYITDVFYRGALGEVFAFAIVPIIILGAYYLIEKNDNPWLLLSIGFSLLLLTHNISFFLICIAFGIYIMLNLKKMNVEKWKSLFKAIVLALGLTAFFLFPMIEQLQLGIYRVSTYFSDDSFINSLLSLSQIIDIRSGTGLIWGEKNNAINMSIGIIQILVVIISLFLMKKNPKVLICSFSVILIILMTSNIFPWRIMPKPNFIQFSCRLLIIAIPICALIGGAVCKGRKRITILLMFLCVTFGLIQIVPVVSLSKINETNLRTLDLYYYGRGDQLSKEIWALGALDYMPSSIYTEIESREKCIFISNDRKITNFEQGYNLLSFTDNSEAIVEYVVPLIYYKGYKILQEYNGIKLEIVAYPSEEGYIAFQNRQTKIDVQYTIKYEDTFVQKVSKMISIFCLLIVLVLGYNKNKLQFKREKI